jgi:hydroxymethylbilane synthase
VFYPAAGQGAIGLEIRSDDGWMKEVVGRIGHGDTFLRVSAEREFLRLLDAGCHTPVGVFSELENDDLIMSARVFPEAGGEPRLANVRGSRQAPFEVAKQLFETLV